MGKVIGVGLDATKNGYPQVTVVEQIPNGVQHHVVIRRSNGDFVCDTASQTDLDLYEIARAELAWTPADVLDSIDAKTRKALAVIAQLPAKRRDRVLAELRKAS